MTEQVINTQDTEVKDVEGSVAEVLAKEEQVAPEKPAKPDTVPLSVYLELKDDLKSLRKEIKDSESSKKLQLKLMV